MTGLLGIALTRRSTGAPWVLGPLRGGPTRRFRDTSGGACTGIGSDPRIAKVCSKSDQRHAYALHPLALLVAGEQ
jgi:hypothetical protein